MNESKYYYLGEHLQLKTTGKEIKRTRRSGCTRYALSTQGTIVTLYIEKLEARLDGLCLTSRVEIKEAFKKHIYTGLLLSSSFLVLRLFYIGALWKGVAHQKKKITFSNWLDEFCTKCQNVSFHEHSWMIAHVRVCRYIHQLEQ